MLKGISSYQIEALSQASESSHTMIISRPGRDVVTRRPTRWAAPGYDPIEQRPEVRRPRSTLPNLISKPRTTRPVRSLDGSPGAKQGLHLDKIVNHKVDRPSCIEGWIA